MPHPAPAPTSAGDVPAIARWLAVSAEHGVASLRHTHWLDAQPRAYDDAPGLWRAAGGRVRGTRVPAGALGPVSEAPVSAGDGAEEVVLAPGEHIDVGRLRLKAMGRGEALALRVFDPEAPGRTRLRGILSFPHDDGWVLEGSFRPAEAGQTRVVESIDGHEREEGAVGTVLLEVRGEPVELAVSGDDVHGYSAVIADATGGDDAYGFRFLPIDPPAPDGTVTVDFNRAYLPPCAFSDQYVCPLPPASNRLSVRVEAGERLAELA